jgi:hypothetical protein
MVMRRSLHSQTCGALQWCPTIALAPVAFGRAAHGQTLSDTPGVVNPVVSNGRTWCEYTLSVTSIDTTARSGGRERTHER